MTGGGTPLQSYFAARLRRPSQPLSVGLPALGVAILAYGVATWMFINDQPDTDRLGPYGPELTPIWIATLATAMLATGIAEMLPARWHRLVVGLRAFSIFLRVASFAVWGVVAWGIFFP